MLTKSTTTILAQKNQRKIALIAGCCHPFLLQRCYASSEHGHDKPHPIDDPNIPRQPDLYRPGSDSFAYENPWPKLNKGRLDWLFTDGWRRPLASDQGGFLRRQWLWLNQNPRDEYQDWKRYHLIIFLFATVASVYFTFLFLFCRSEWPQGHEWALREAHFEMIRREKAGLPYISPELIERTRVEACLPSEEELRDFTILI